jgi:hypothetical protein
MLSAVGVIGTGVPGLRADQGLKKQGRCFSHANLAKAAHNMHTARVFCQWTMTAWRHLRAKAALGRIKRAKAS